MARSLTLAAFVMLGASCSLHPAPEGPQEALDSGWDRFRFNDYSGARAYFEYAVEHAPPGSGLRAESLYGLAVFWNHRRPGNNPERAKARYEQVVSEYREHEMAAWSLLGLARMKHLALWGRDRMDDSPVREAYQRVIDRFPNHRAGEEAFIYLQALRIVKLDPNESGIAAAELEGFIRDHPASPYLAQAYHVLAECYYDLDDPEKRIWAKSKAIKVAVNDQVTPVEMNESLYVWLVACMAEFDAGDFETARKYYRRLIAEFPENANVLEAQNALQRMDAVERRTRETLRAELAGATGNTG